MARTRDAKSARESKPKPSEASNGRSPKGRLHEEAASMLRKIILSGELAPGERLREVQISERLGMSRTPVREAFRTLAAEDLIDLLPNRSVVVSDVKVADTPDVFAVLGVLEALAAQLACHRMTGDQIDILMGLQDDLETQFQASDRGAYAETNRIIHELIVEGSENQALITAWRMVLPRVQRARTLNNLDRARWAEAAAEHRQMTDALAARNGQRLAELILLHFDNGVASMLKQHPTEMKKHKYTKFPIRTLTERGESLLRKYRSRHSS
jgi:DNA-binding GntR family transcriptional regulator